MRLSNIFILIFLMSAFAVGVSLQDSDMELIDASLDNASIVVQNITLTRSGEQYTDGMLTILEQFVNFISVAFLEVMRLGILFGSENPQYFEPDFIFAIMKLITWLVIISLLIKPLFYLIVIMIMIIIWIGDKIKKRRDAKLGEDESK